MSEIILALRSPKLVRTVIVEQEDGAQICMIVGSMSFIYQPVYYSFSRYDYGYSQFERQSKRLEKLWEGKPRPMCVAHTESNNKHKIQIGQWVFRYNHSNGMPMIECPFQFYTGNYKDEIVVGKIVSI
jgi:hypothetical protein